MYDWRMADEETDIIAARLDEAMAARKISAAQLAREAGVDRSTISLILAGKRPNTPAVVIGRLAGALLVSVDYLVGATEDMQPKGLGLDEVLIELAQVARKLTSRRRRDLLLTAHAYLRANEDLAGNPDLLMDNLLDMIAEAGGTISRDRLLDILEADNDDARALLAGSSPSE